MTLIRLATDTNDVTSPVIFVDDVTGQIVLGPAGQSLTGLSGPALTASVQAPTLPIFANNAAAVAGGVAVGGFYRTGLDPDTVCVVH